MPLFSIFILSIVTPLFSFWIFFFSSALQPAASVFLAYRGFVFCGEPSEVLIIKSSPHCWQHLPPIWRAFWTWCAVMKIVFLHKANDFSLHQQHFFSFFCVRMHWQTDSLWYHSSLACSLLHELTARGRKCVHWQKTPAQSKQKRCELDQMAQGQKQFKLIW